MEHSVSSWAELYQQVLMQLHEKDKSILTKLAVNKDPNVDLSSHFSVSADKFSFCRKIDDSIFVLTGTDTQSKLNMLRKVFALFGVDEGELVFYLHENEETDEKGETRHEIRKKYWQYAIDLIREKTDTFTYSGETTSNTIAGVTGRVGVQILCVANFDIARVDLYIDFGDWDKNKALFDELFRHKTDIETAFGTLLIWNRNDDTRASKISCVLEDVSIGTEADWPRMAKFHAEKAAALMKAVVKYICCP